jgi:quinol monooxygenase YgiN
MIIRIVRMTFTTGNAEAFRVIFARNREGILGMDGCHHLELWQDTDNPSVFVTYSHWESVRHLNAYRQTAFFEQVWKETRELFSEKAIAFSVEQVM